MRGRLNITNRTPKYYGAEAQEERSKGQIQG